MEVAVAAVISALITGVLGPVLTLVISQRNQNSKLPTTSEVRLKKLQGKWFGVFVQNYGGEKKRFEGVAFFRVQGRRIIGNIEYEGFQGMTKLSIENGTFDGNILKIEYRNEKGYVVQYGSAITRMNSRGDFFKGSFIGFSPGQEEIVTGQVYFSIHPLKEAFFD